MNTKTKSNFLTAIFGFVTAVASYRLVREGIHNSSDLEVYWKYSQVWLHGVSPYLFDANDLGRVFKYPPWTLPLFLPMALIPFGALRWIWAFVELGCIAYALNWLSRAEVKLTRSFLIAILFWWIWLGHFYTGQITLALLAISLWIVKPQEETRSQLSVAFLSLVLSIKVFSMVTILGVGKVLFKPRTIAFAAALFIGFDLLAWSLVRHPVAWGDLGLIEFHHQWIVSASSAASGLGADVVRGHGNHGFTGALLRWFQVDPLDSSKDGWIACVLAALFSGLWFHFSKALDHAEKWAGWLCVGLLIHPLVWHHSFVLAFPACVLAVDRALKSKSQNRKLLVASAYLAIILICLLVPNIFPMEWISPFEYLGSKAWGVVLACSVLVMA